MVRSGDEEEGEVVFVANTESEHNHKFEDDQLAVDNSFENDGIEAGIENDDNGKSGHEESEQRRFDKNKLEERGLTGATMVTVNTKVVVFKDYQVRFNKGKLRQIQHLVEYLRVFFALVNFILKRFDKRVLDLQLAITGVVLLTEEETAFLPKVKGDNRTVDQYAYDPFKSFIKASPALSDSDVVLFFTGLYIGKTLKGGKIHRGTEGFGMVGGACTASRFAVVTEVPGSFQAVMTTVHEFLHVLGCVHDGSGPPHYLKNSPGAKSCATSHGMIMNTFRVTDGEAMFSNCTRDQVLAFLRNPRARCLSSNTPRHRLIISRNKTRSSWPDRQVFCEMFYPKEKTITFVEGLGKYSIKSCSLVCLVRDGKRVGYYVHAAPDFVQCEASVDGETKVCFAKRCIAIEGHLTTYMLGTRN
ncbi:uncharacterized protein LOC144104548 [Amblyomma americanum]